MDCLWQHIARINHISYCVALPTSIGADPNDTYAYGRLNPVTYLIGSPFYEDVNGDGILDELQEVHVQPSVFTEGTNNWISFWAWVPNGSASSDYEM